MRVLCPKCRSDMSVPDEWAGRAVRCPGCGASLKLPAAGETPPAEAPGEEGPDLKDLEALAADRSDEGFSLRRLKGMVQRAFAEEEEAAQPPAAPRPATASGRQIVCRYCGHVFVPRPGSPETRCPGCWRPLPELARPAKPSPTADVGKPIRRGGYLSQLLTAIFYPLNAVPRIVEAMVAVFVINVAAIVAYVAVMQFLGGAPAETVRRWSGLAARILLSIQCVYFGLVMLRLLTATIAATVLEKDEAPRVPLAPRQWGAATIAMPVVYGGVFLLMLLAANNGNVTFPPTRQQWANLLEVRYLAVTALLLLLLPIVLVAMGSARPLDAFNPVALLRALFNTAERYLAALALTVVVIVGDVAFTLWIVARAQAWMTQVGQAQQISEWLPYLKVILTISLAVGLGFAAAYAVGRICGIFANRYRHRMPFVF